MGKETGFKEFAREAIGYKPVEERIKGYEEFLVAPSEVVVKDGKVAGLKCSQMVLGPYDKSGRRRPVAQKDGDFRSRGFHSSPIACRRA